MDFDLKKWLRDDMKFSDAEVEEMAPKFTPERVSALASTHKAQAEIAETRRRLDEENDRINREMAEWAALTAEEKRANEAMRQRIESAETRAFQLESRLKQLATDHGVDPKTVLPAGEPIVSQPKTPDAPAVDLSKYVPVEHFNAISAYNLELPAKLMSIAHQHQSLTGEILDTTAIVKEIRAQAGKKDGVVDPVAIWERMYDIPAKRESAARAKYEADIKAAEDRGAERVRTEAAMPPSAIPGRHAPVFGTRGSSGEFQPRTSALKRPQPETGVRSAAAALASGKYRQKATA